MPWNLAMSLCLPFAAATLFPRDGLSKGEEGVFPWAGVVDPDYHRETGVDSHTQSSLATFSVFRTSCLLNSVTAGKGEWKWVLKPSSTAAAPSLPPSPSACAPAPPCPWPWSPGALWCGRAGPSKLGHVLPAEHQQHSGTGSWTTRSITSLVPSQPCHRPALLDTWLPSFFSPHQGPLLWPPLGLSSRADI